MRNPVPVPALVPVLVPAHAHAPAPAPVPDPAHRRGHAQEPCLILVGQPPATIDPGLEDGMDPGTEDRPGTGAGAGQGAVDRHPRRHAGWTWRW